MEQPVYAAEVRKTKANADGVGRCESTLLLGAFNGLSQRSSADRAQNHARDLIPIPRAVCNSERRMATSPTRMGSILMVPQAKGEGAEMLAFTKPCRIIHHQTPTPPADRPLPSLFPAITARVNGHLNAVAGYPYVCKLGFPA